MPAIVSTLSAITRWTVGGALLFFVGCSRPTPASLATNAMAAPAMEVSDAASQPNRFRALFADGSVPSDTERKRFADYMYLVSSVSATSDSQATVHILVDDDMGRRVGEVDWIVVQTGGRWKLKSAPLP